MTDPEALKARAFALLMDATFQSLASPRPESDLDWQIERDLYAEESAIERRIRRYE
jgi:hypothetical protein